MKKELTVRDFMKATQKALTFAKRAMDNVMYEDVICALRAVEHCAQQALKKLKD